MNSHWLAYRSVNWVIDVETLKGVVGRVEHGKNADNAIMVDFIVAKIQLKQFVVRKKKFGYHHGTVSLYFI